MNNRLEVLDSLRGIAAMGVVLHHFIVIYGIKYGFGDIKYPPEWLDISIGRYGVELFFIISGFVISLTLEKGNSVIEFAISRFSRLFPTYWFCLSLTSITLFFFSGVNVFDEGQFIYNLTMAPLFFWKDPVDGSYWTLMYELFFYFIIAILFGRLGQITTKRLILFFVIFSCFALYNFFYPIHVRVQYVLLFPHLNLFWAGIIFYKIWKSKRDNSGPTTHFYALISLLLFIQWSMCLLSIGRVNIYSSVLISLYFLLFYLFINNKLSYLNNKYLVALGTISYSLYLIHQEIGYILIDFLYEHSNSIFISIFLSILFCISLATIINRYIEITSNKMCKKWLLKLTSTMRS